MTNSSESDTDGFIHRSVKWLSLAVCVAVVAAMLALLFSIVNIQNINDSRAKGKADTHDQICQTIAALGQPGPQLDALELKINCNTK